MKKIIAGTALSLAVLFTTNSSQAQDYAAGIYIGPKHSRVVDPGTGRDYRIVDATEVNVRAMRDFSKNYSKAEKVAWVQGKNGTSVYFTLGGLNMRSTYDKAGRKEYTLKYYSDASMPSSLRHMVKSRYYDFTIDQVTEIDRNNAKYYLVKMQSAKEHLTVKIVDGDITPYERISKAD